MFTFLSVKLYFCWLNAYPHMHQTPLMNSTFSVSSLVYVELAYIFKWI